MLFEMRIEDDTFIFDGIDIKYQVRVPIEKYGEFVELFKSHQVFQYVDFNSFKENAERGIEQQFFINEIHFDDFINQIKEQEFIELIEKE